MHLNVAQDGDVAPGAVRRESTLRYRPDIDGLRAVAILPVVLFHTGVPFFGGGFVGVDIFFVISGFLIGGIVHRDVLRGRFSFATFYTRRAKRILPALLAMILVVSIAALCLLPPAALRSYTASQATALVGTSNLRFWYLTHFSDVAWQRDPLVMTWSLGVEEQFYLFLPPLMLLLHRLAPRSLALLIALFAAASFLLSIWLTRAMPTAAFYLLPGRAWELGVGVLLALWKDARPARLGTATADILGLCGLAAVALSVAAFDNGTPFPGIAAALSVLGSAALILGEGGLVNRFLLSWPPVRLIGALSYSWYLWHWPPVVFARLRLGREPTMPELLGIAAITFGLAFLSWRFLETPFRRPSRLPAPRLLMRYGVAIAVSLLLAAAIRFVASERLSPVYATGASPPRSSAKAIL